MIDHTLLFIKTHLIPTRIFSFFQPAYHYTLALIAALIYRFPSRKLKVVAVTGTKGKSSTVELISALLEEAGYNTALSNTIRTKIGQTSDDNLFKMSMPGRFFVQHFIRRAVQAKCDFLVLEMTSQGAIQSRHRFIDIDTFVLTNISPEHIEAHGSYEAYVEAKLSIARRIETSKKPIRTIITNTDDKESPRFAALTADRKMSYSIADAQPYTLKNANGPENNTAGGIDFTLAGRPVHSPLSGLFNLYNILAAVSAARAHGVTDDIIIRAIEKFSGIKGRVERVSAGQDFSIIVDYAHTPDSLEKLYQVFESSRNICILGGTGGGRDTWKRTEMGRIANAYCEEIILTNEDPYDEDPMQIIDHVKDGIIKSGGADKVRTIIDRREAIATAVSRAQTGDTIIITGKGTDPYIMGPKGSKIPWSDAQVAREEIAKHLTSTAANTAH